MIKIIPFLTQLADNNNRPWFEAHKGEYKAALDEFTQIVTDAMAECGKLGMPPQEGVEAKNLIMRIYRDVRFSPDKSPYKKNMAASIAPGGRKGGGPAVYLHIQPGECFLGFGMYEMESDRLKRLRQELDYNYQEFKGLIEDPAFRTFWGEPKGEKLKTLPKGYEAQNPAIELLKMKQLYFIHDLKSNETNERIVPQLCAHALQLSLPVYEFFKRTRVGEEPDTM